MTFGEFIASANSIMGVIAVNASILPLAIFVLFVVSFFIDGRTKGLITQVISIFSLIISITLAKMYGGVVSTRLRKYFVDALLKSLDIVKRSLANVLSNKLHLPVANKLIEEGVNTATGALANFVSNMLGYVIVFIASMIVVGIISNLFVGLNLVPIIGSLNKLLGGALGIVKAIILVEVIFFVMEQASFIPAVNVAISYVRASPILSDLWTHNFVYMIVLPRR